MGKHFSVSKILCYFVTANATIPEKNEQINTKAMQKYLGIPVIVLGALLLVLSYFMDWTDNNVLQFCSLGLIIVGLIAHIAIQKKME